MAAMWIESRGEEGISYRGKNWSMDLQYKIKQSEMKDIKGLLEEFESMTDYMIKRIKKRERDLTSN